MGQVWQWLFMLLSLASMAAGGIVVFQGQPGGTITATTGYPLVQAYPPVEYSRIQISVDITLQRAADAQNLRLYVNFPGDLGWVPPVTSTISLDRGRTLQVYGGGCASSSTFKLIIDSESQTTGCTGNIMPTTPLVIAGLNTNAQPWSVPKPVDVAPPTPPTSTLPNQWILYVVPVAPAAGGNVVVNAWSIIFTTQCTTLVPNSVNVATSKTSGDTLAVTCSSGFSATSTATMTCAVTGYTSPVACINGGGAVLTWGLQGNPTLTGASLVDPLGILGRVTAASRVNHYDPTMNFMWLPNGVWATRVALGDLCTLVMSNGGIVYRFGYCGSPAAALTATPGVSAEIVALPNGALATMIYATHFTFAAITPGNQLIMWGVQTSTMGPTVLNVWGPSADRLCGFTWVATPTAVTGLPGALIFDVALAINRVAIVTTAGEIYAWGCNGYYSLGSTYDARNIKTSAELVITKPTKITATGLPQTILYVAMGEYQTIALSSDKNIYFWGVTPETYNYAQTVLAGKDVPASVVVPLVPRTAPTAANAINFETDYLAPAVRDSTRQYVSISANRWTFAGLTTSGSVYTWGYTFYPGNPTAPIVPTTVPVTTFIGVLGREVVGNFGFDNAIGEVTWGTGVTRTIRQVAMGGTFGLAIDTNGNVLQWGNLLTDNVQLNPTTVAVTDLRSDNWRWSSGQILPRALTIPSGEVIMYVTAGRETAAALDARNGAAGCPSVGGIMTSQDVAFIPKMNDKTRAQLCAGMTTVSICGATNWVNTFLNIPFISTPYSVTMPSYNKGVTISITKFNKVKFMVVSAYAPNGASVAAVGITPAQGRPLLFLFQIEQMHLDSSMMSSNPLTVQVTVADLTIVYVYRDEYRNGQQLTGDHGGVTSSGTTYTLSLTHTSAVAGYGAYDDGDESNEALLGLLGLIALPVICALGLYIWLWYRYTHTEAVVEAANPVAPVFMMEPQPMVAPSPAYIPAAYPAAPAYYV